MSNEKHAGRHNAEKFTAYKIPKTNIAAAWDLRGQRVQDAGLESSVKEIRPVRLRLVIILRD
jgi:hypothetical protein